MADQSGEGIKSALALGGDAERIRDYYADWAEHYDADVESEGYRAPDVVASLSATVAAGFLRNDRAHLAVMDAGCGTGLTGVALKRLGFEAIDGFDISSDMVAAAKATGAYRTLVGDVDLNAESVTIGGPDGGYDLVVCVGVFTLGHVAPEGLRHLLTMTRAGGFIVASTRDGYLAETDFAAVVDRLVAEGACQHVMRLKDARYVGADKADYWVLRRPLATE